ncbi:MAG: DNA adenine methylase, partial [Actinomycetia bacterium]|nr:DNA adenine methylase [Actinomycetes bacterium]
MTLRDESLSKAPMPYFGGKRKAAELVWNLLGDCPHYVEPFAGSLAVLLERPHPANRPYSSETVNDADGLIVNVWRAIAQHPEQVAEAAS